MSEISVYANKRMYLIGLLAAIALFVIGFVMRGDGSDWIMAYVVMVLSGTAALALGQKLFRRRPLIIINEDGIVDQFSMYRLGLIKWGDIDLIAVREDDSKGNKSLVIVPDPDYVQSIVVKKTALKRYLMKKDEEIGGFEIRIPQVAISTPIDELIATIDRYDPYADKKRK